MAKHSAKAPAVSVAEKILNLRREIALLEDDLLVRELYDTFSKSYVDDSKNRYGQPFKRDDYTRYHFLELWYSRPPFRVECWIRAVIMHLNAHVLKKQMKVAMIDLPPKRLSGANKEEYLRFQLEHLLKL